MSVKEAIIRAFLKFNIFAKTSNKSTLGDKVEESGFISEEELKRKIVEEIVNSKAYLTWKDKKGK